MPDGTPTREVRHQVDGRPFSPASVPDSTYVMAGVPDPRSRRGIRHRFVSVLALAVCAVLAGARSYVAIAEWAHDWPLGSGIRIGLIIRRATPSESDDPPPAAKDRSAGAGPGGVQLADQPRRQPRPSVAIRGAGADRHQPEVPDDRRVMLQGCRGGRQVARRGRHPDGRRAPAGRVRDRQRDRAGAIGSRRQNPTRSPVLPRSWAGSTSSAD
jgi:DDE_Tnp_1-associated